MAGQSLDGNLVPISCIRLAFQTCITVKSRLPRKDAAFAGVNYIYQRPYIRETMHSALNLQCTIRAQLISATRGCASQPKVLAMATDCSATCQQG